MWQFLKSFALLTGVAFIGATSQPMANSLLIRATQRLDSEASPARVSLRTTGVSVTPFMADAFANSLGVNTRFGQSIYSGQRATVEHYLVELGFRHIRDGGVIYNAETRQYLRSLCSQYGIHPSLGLNDTDSDAAIVQYVKDVPCIDMVEGPNELNGQPNWKQRLATFMPHVYNLVRMTPAFAHVPVVGPSITSIEDADQLGATIDLSKAVDMGNKHSYPGEVNIGGSDGTGDHGFGRSHEQCPKYSYGSFFYNVCLAQLATQGRPIWATETGYSSTPAGLATPPQHPPYGSISYDVAVKYFPRLMAYEFLNGISRTYIMALLDGSSGCNGPFNTLGLIEQDCPNTGLPSSLHPKPQFYALKNLMATVSDPGPTFSPTPLTLRVAGSDSKFQLLVLQKRNGENLLLYWVEGTDWNVNAGKLTVVSPESITLSIAGMTGNLSAKAFAFDGDGALTHAEVRHFSGGNIALTATDSIQFLTFEAPQRH